MRQYRVGNTVAYCDDTVTRVKNVILARHGLILDQDFNILADVNCPFRFWSTLWAAYWRPNDYLPDHLLHIPRKPLRTLPKNTYVYGLTFFNKQIFGHLWDTIQSLKNVEGGTLLYNEQSEVVDLEKHWDAFGYRSDQRLPIDVIDNNFLIPDLIVPQMVIAPNMIHSNYVEWLLNHYYAWAKPYLDNIPRKLYLSRHGCASRKVLNEDKIKERLRRKGFITVTGQEPLELMIRLFYSATTIVGYHGSLFRNILFCNNDPHVVELCAGPRMEDPSFPRIAKVRGLTRYNREEVACDEEYNTRIPAKWLVNRLEKLEPQAPDSFCFSQYSSEESEAM